MHIPLIDLHAQYRAIKPEVVAAIEEVLEGMLPSPYAYQMMLLSRLPETKEDQW
jgi:hypothetical protein